MMGSVHAKGLDREPSSMEEDDEREVFLRDMPATVKRIHVEGLKRTKNDIVVPQLKQIFSAKNFEEVVQKSKRGKDQLKRLGLFSSVEVTIDVGHGADDTDTCYEVVYKVQEPRRVSGGINTLVGTNEGSLLFSLRAPNMCGRGEKVTAEFTYGTKNASSSSLLFTKPVRANPDLNFQAGAFRSAAEHPFSGYSEQVHGLSTEFSFPTPLGSHSLRWEGIWRQLGCLSDNTAFSIREQAGHSLKSALKHTLTRDTRDSTVLPSGGFLLRATQELTGFGGDVNFAKQEVDLQLNKSLILDTVLQVCLSGGVMKSLSSDRLLVNDKFHLGGPLTLRGFTMHGAGPHEQGCALGGNAYWCGGLHFYTPLPFRRSKGGFSDLFRTHFFVNAGNLTNIKLDDAFMDNISNLRERFRWSYGLGMVLKLGGVARLEFNYCWPMAVQQGDSVVEGAQFGIGVHFI